MNCNHGLAPDAITQFQEENTKRQGSAAHVRYEMFLNVLADPVKVNIGPAWTESEAQCALNRGS